MAMRYGHEVGSRVHMPDGSMVPFKELTREKSEYVINKVVENASRAIGTYLSEHPEEIEPFSRCKDVKLIPDNGGVVAGGTV